MRVFISGATSVLGQSIVRDFMRAGHQVIGLARTEASRSLLHALKATAYYGYGRDIDRLADALATVDAIVHAASTLPSTESPVEDEWMFSEEIVSGLLHNLISAAVQSGCKKVVLMSSYAIYGDHGAGWVTERTTLAPVSGMDAYLEAEHALQEATTERHISGVILRAGMLYAPTLPQTQALFTALREGLAGLGPGADAYWPLLHVVDAAQAARLALEGDFEGQAFNICDDEPVTQAGLYQVLEQWLGRPPGKSGTEDLLRFIISGSHTALRPSVRMSNQRAREQLGFQPRYPTFQEGMRAALDEWLARQH
ncbi:MAG: NAD(P)-dependent oxidoreductase [Anaerolineae bacterium]|nr:NAD(P)-dependent oxidoreductase [Anaerolineae bacterium]